MRKETKFVYRMAVGRCLWHFVCVSSRWLVVSVYCWQVFVAFCVCQQQVASCVRILLAGVCGILCVSAAGG
jgi:hypothetical protein